MSWGGLTWHDGSRDGEKGADSRYTCTHAHKRSHTYRQVHLPAPLIGPQNLDVRHEEEEREAFVVPRFMDRV